MSPILSRRRAEARLREATQAHENSVTQIKTEVVEIERRMHKQQCWMDHVNEQVLKAEIQKVQCRVRLDKAERRVKSLSADLSKAYENVVSLLEERLRLEDAKARNEALVAYLDVIGRADWNNQVYFEDNKSELCRLLECCRKSSEGQDKFDGLVEEVHQNEMFIGEVLSKCQELVRFHNELLLEWTKIPAALKESVFLQTHMPSSPDSLHHPVSAMQQCKDALAYIMEDMKLYADMLTKVPFHKTYTGTTTLVQQLELPT